MFPSPPKDHNDQESLRALAELVPDFVLLLERGGLVRYVSPAIRCVLGLDPDAVKGRRFVDLVHHEDCREAERTLEKLERSGSVVMTSLRYLDRNGSCRVLETFGRKYSTIDALDGVLISTRDITERVETERALREALAEACDLYNLASCGYHSLNAAGTFVRINDTELRWLGYTREEVIGKLRFRDLLKPEAQPAFDRSYADFQRGGKVDNLEFELQRKGGGTLQVLLSASAIYDQSGQYCGSRSSVTDITERKRSERALGRVCRALRVRSSVNSALIRAQREPELLEAVCRVIVEPGGYRMAWVGSVQHDRDRTVRVEARAGFEEGYLREANISWSEQSERGRGPTGVAIRTGTPQINRNFQFSPEAAPWRHEAIERGYQSSIALPLKDEQGVSFASLAIYAAEPDAFDQDELELLLALSEDLAFGIRALRESDQHRVTQEAVRRLAYSDPLTGLPNRARLLAQVNDDRASTSRLAPMAVLTLLVDRFDDIQSVVGIHQADRLLCQIANRLQTAIGEGESLARIGNDTFAVFQPAGDASTAEQRAREFCEAVARPFQIAGLPLTAQLIVGAALAPQHGEEAEMLLVRSASAARRARRTRSHFLLFEGMSEAESPESLALITDLRLAIERCEIAVFYQPKVALRPARVTGAEALLRWTHPVRGPVSPARFVPLAERTGLIRPLTAYVLDTVTRQLREWQDQGCPVPVAVNVSAWDFNQPDFAGQVLELIRSRGLRSEWLQLEITEGTLMGDPERVRDQLLRLAQEGLSIAIDDFGTGYSSLTYVANLPVASLKIDRSFVIEMASSQRVYSIVSATISLARALGLRTVAEGVEQPEQAEELVRLGCDELQGFLYSPAIPAEGFQAWAKAFPASVLRTGGDVA